MVSLAQPLPWFDVAPPSLVDPQGQFQVGRFKQAFTDANFDGGIVPSWGRLRRGPVQGTLQNLARRPFTKEWHYLSIVSSDLFVALGPVQLGYISNLFVYVVDRHTGAFQEVGDRVPLGRGFHLAPSSLVGTTRWQHGRNQVEVVATPSGWQLKLHIQGAGLELQGEAEITRGEALALVFPLGGGRVAYTHKEAGLPARGSLTWNDRRFSLDNALATSDWTRSFANRHTQWQWASLAGLQDGRRVGLNLSALVYDREGVGSQENALWIDGKLFPLGGVVFELPTQPGGRWRIVGGDINAPWCDLHFIPQGERQENANFGVVQSRFVQPYGQFQGFVEAPGASRLDINGLFGVVENHHSVW